MSDDMLEIPVAEPEDGQSEVPADALDESGVHDYRNSEQWAIFAEKYFASKGKIAPAAREANLSGEYCRRLYRTNSDFRDWLKEQNDLRFMPVKIAIDNRIIESVVENRPITPEENRSFRLALDRLGVIDKTLIGINVNTNGSGGPTDFSDGMRADLLIWIKKNPGALNG
jgi:hypothetical protein